MKRICIMSMIFLFASALFNGCSKEEEQEVTYSITITNPLDYAIKIAYLCVYGNDNCDFDPGQTRTYANQKLHTENEVHMIVMRKTPLEGEPDWANYVSSIKFLPEPGKSYAWTIGNSMISEITDPGSGAGCGVYAGPDFDIQIDGQCKVAFAYKCAGNEQARKAACDVYKQWQQHQSGIPNCPYCN